MSYSMQFVLAPVFVRNQLSFHFTVDVTRLKNTKLRVDPTSIRLNIRAHYDIGIVPFRGQEMKQHLTRAHKNIHLVKIFEYLLIF